MEIQDAENAVREIGTAAIDAVQGLDSATIEGSLPFIAGVLILLIAVKFLSLPFKLVWNGVIGAAVAGKPYRCSRGLRAENNCCQSAYRRYFRCAGPACGFVLGNIY